MTVMSLTCHSDSLLRGLTDEALKDIIERYDRDWLQWDADTIKINYFVAVAALAEFIDRHGFDPRTGEVTG